MLRLKNYGRYFQEIQVSPKKMTEPMSIRLDQEVYDQLCGVIEATGGEITRSEIINRSVRLFLHVLSSEPSMIAGYNRLAGKSVTQKTGS